MVKTMNNSSNEVVVHCNECEKQGWCAMRQHMKYTLGIEDAYCTAGTIKEDEEE